MKSLVLLFVLLLSASMPLACRQNIPSVVPSVTPTPTINVVCGFTPYNLGNTTVAFNTSSPQLITSLTQWNTIFSNTGSVLLNATPVIPTPPDFTQQMAILLVSPVCPTVDVSIASVCEGPSQVVVTLTEQQRCSWCYTFSSAAYPSVVTIPRSNLPFSVFTTVLPTPVCWATPSPTPTP